MAKGKGFSGGYGGAIEALEILEELLLQHVDRRVRSGIRRFEGVRLGLCAVVAVRMGDVRGFQAFNKPGVVEVAHAAAIRENPIDEVALIYVVHHVRCGEVERVDGVALADDLRQSAFVVKQRHDGKIGIVFAV